MHDPGHQAGHGSNGDSENLCDFLLRLTCKSHVQDLLLPDRQLRQEPFPSFIGNRQLAGSRPAGVRFIDTFLPVREERQFPSRGSFLDQEVIAIDFANLVERHPGKILHQFLARSKLPEFFAVAEKRSPNGLSDVRRVEASRTSYQAASDDAKYERAVFAQKLFNG